MDWNETRRKLLQLALGRRVEGNGRTVSTETWRKRPAVEVPPAPPLVDRPGIVRAASICVASGKGGTGKSIVSAALATLFGVRGRTLVVDADLGVGNAHILQDVSPPLSFVDVVSGGVSAREALVVCSGQVDLLAAGSGVPRMAELTVSELHLVAAGLEDLERDYRYLVVDSAAGVSLQTVGFARACDVTLVVTTPDLTAMTDAYAFMKVLAGRDPGCRLLLLVNRAADEETALDVTERLGRVCRRFIGRSPRLIGWLPEDPEVTRSVNERGPVVILAPEAPASMALRRVAVEVLEELHREHSGGFGRRFLRDLEGESGLR
jgi:flagellar biosynthesis protein FlhG